MDDVDLASVYDLFPERVTASCIQRDITQQEIDFAQQSIGMRAFNLLDAEPMKDLREHILGEIDKYTRNIIAPRNDVSLRLTTSWSANARDDHALKRNNSYVSGVFFLDANKRDGDVITFLKPQESSHLFIPTYAPNLSNMDVCEIGTDAGYLFIFSSRLVHLSKSSGTYIAFNTFPVGWLGDEGDRDSFWV